MSDDSINNNQLRIHSRGVAEVSENLNSVLIGPVVYDETHKKDVDRLEELGLRFKEAAAQELNLISLNSGRQILFPVLMDDIQWKKSSLEVREWHTCPASCIVPGISSRAIFNSGYARAISIETWPTFPPTSTTRLPDLRECQSNANDLLQRALLEN